MAIQIRSFEREIKTSMWYNSVTFVVEGLRARLRSYSLNEYSHILKLISSQILPLETYEHCQFFNAFFLYIGDIKKEKKKKKTDPCLVVLDVCLP